MKNVDEERAMGGPDVKASVISGLRWTTLSRAIMQLVTWSATLLVVRMLTPVDYGLVAMAGILASYLSLMGELGVSTVLVQKRTRDRSTLQALFGAVVSVGVVLCATTLGAAPFIAAYFKQDELIPLGALAAAQFLVMPFTVIPQAMLMMDLRFKALGAAGITYAGVGAASTLILAAAGFGPYALMWGTLLSAISRAVALNASAPFFSMPRFSFRAIREFAGFSGYVLSARSIWYWYAEADSIIIGTALGPTSLGFFSVAKQLASIPLDRFAEIINTIALPTFTAVKEDGSRVRQGYLAACRIAAAMAFPVFAGFAVVAEDVIRLTIGNKWDPAIPAVQLLCIAMPLRLIGTLASPTVMAIGRPEVSLRYVLWAAICVPAGILVGVQWGVIGVAAAWAICYPVAFLGGSWHISHALGCPLRMVLTPLIAPMLSAMTMVVAVRGANQVLLRNSGLPLRIALSVCLGVIVYSGILWVVSRAHFMEAWQLARSLVTRRTLTRATAL